MIVEYFRPNTITEALSLIGRENPLTIPIGGGTSIRQKSRLNDLSVVDLQALKLNKIECLKDWLEIGATTTLSALEGNKEIPEAIREAVHLEGTANTRNLATLGGRLVSCDGKSALITTLIAADAITVWDENCKEIPLGEWLALPSDKPGKLLLSIKIKRNFVLELEVINRTKLDLPILCIAVARWNSGRVRVALGGFGKAPQMVFDGPDGNGAEQAAENACREADDFCASSDYRRAMAILLTRRCLARIQG
ncbi:MAG: FAD binding domain-containing protein [Anaerolineaceae bacterium]